MNSQVSEQHQISYDQVIQHLSNNNLLPSLKHQPFRDLFPQSEHIPQQLTYNLNSDTRIIRKIQLASNFSHCLFRGFYFQLLKLCYQLYNEQSSKNYIQIVKSIVFDKALLQNEQSQRYLKYLAQFFVLMDNGEEQDYALFQDILAEYYEVDQAFIYVFDFILQSQSHLGQDSDVETVLNELCDFFQIGLISNHPFYKFQESDIYLFIEGDSAVYLVYDQPEVHEISHISSSKRSQQRGQSKLSRQQQSNNGQRFGQLEQTAKSPAMQLNQQHNNEHRQTDQVAFQQIEHISRPLSKASAKSNNKVQTHEYQRQEENRNYPVHNIKTTNLTVNSYQPTYASPKSIHNNYYSPTRDIESKPSSNQRRGEQTPIQYSASSYYQGIYADIPHNTSSHLNSSKNDTIMNIFGDMLKSGKFQSSMGEEAAKSKKNTEQTQKILQSQQEFQQQNPSDLLPNFKKINKVDMSHMIDRAKSVKSVNEHISELNSASIVVSKLNEQNLSNAQADSWNKWTPSLDSNHDKIPAQKTLNKVEQNYTIPQQNSEEPRQVANFDDQDSIFYKPKKSQLKVISQVTASKQTITHRNSDKLDESKGSIYRQFSDTRILKLLKQPYKTKVQLMRNRFKGQHFNL